MFGYITPEKPELKIREFELYKAYYCGICKSIGRRYGQIPRLTLNYDSVFLAMLLDSVLEEIETIEMQTCITHPIKKRPIVLENASIDYAADMHLILSYHKLKDDYNDEHSAKSVIGMALLKNSFKKLLKKYEKQCIIIETCLGALTALEKENCTSVDKVAEPFAQIMRTVFSEEENFAQIGYHLGKWIYMIDAYDDLEDDRKSGSYNPFIAMGDCENLKERASFNLMIYLSKIAEHFALLDIKKNKEILENIIFFGLLKKTESVLERETTTDGKPI